MSDNEMLSGWRKEIAAAIEAAQNELVAARQAFLDIKKAAEVASMRWLALRDRVHGLLRGSESLSTALADRLAAEEPIARAAIGSAGMARREIANLEYRLADMHQALSQLDRVLAPPAWREPEPVLSRHRPAAPEPIDDDVIVFLPRPAGVAA